MKTDIQSAIVKDPTLGPAVNEADDLLRSIVGPSSSWLSSNWALQQDDKRKKIILLTITDFHGSVSAEFAPDELTRPYHLYTRLLQLWSGIQRGKVESLTN
jgi:hypothetical protein